MEKIDSTEIWTGKSELEWEEGPNRTQNAHAGRVRLSVVIWNPNEVGAEDQFKGLVQPFEKSHKRLGARDMEAAKLEVEERALGYLEEAMKGFGFGLKEGAEREREGSVLGEVELPNLPQRQDSTEEQLRDLQEVAERLGMYDGAEVVRELIKR
jgi:hypothetical protein